MICFEDTGLEKKPEFEAAWSLGYGKHVEAMHDDMTVASELSHDKKMDDAAEAFKASNLAILNVIQKHSGNASDALVMTCLLGQMGWKSLAKNKGYLEQSFGHETASLVMNLLEYHGMQRQGLSTKASPDIQKIMAASVIVHLDDFILPKLKDKTLDIDSVKMMVRGVERMNIPSMGGISPALAGAVNTSLQEVKNFLQPPQAPQNNLKPSAPKH